MYEYWLLKLTLFLWHDILRYHQIIFRYIFAVCFTPVSDALSSLNYPQSINAPREK